MDILISAIITVVFLFAAFVAVCFFSFNKFFHKEKKQITADEILKNRFRKKSGLNLKETVKKNTEYIESEEFEAVSIYSKDDLLLSGKLYNSRGENFIGTVILCHGRHSCCEYDFNSVFRMYRGMGYAVLITDLRAHNSSGGEYTTMGIMESFDVVSWCKWIEMKFGTDKDIIIHGFSTGAFAAFASAVNPEMPKNVRCVIAESIYPSVYSYVFNTLKGSFTFLTKPVVSLMNSFFRKKTGFDFRDYALFKVAKSVSVPVIFFHSENDNIAKLSSVKKIAERLSVKNKIITVEEAPFEACFLADFELCSNSLKNFIEEL